MTRPRLALIVLGSCTLGLLAGGEARADCAAPGTAVAPRTGTLVPADPVLHVFVPAYLARKDRHPFRAVAGGERLPIEAAQVSTTDAFVTYRIAVETRSATNFELRQDDRVVAGYRIDPAWKRPDTGFAVAEPERVIDAWTCSHTDAWMITATLAPAYRVTWNALDSGTVVVPDDHAAMFHGGGDGSVGRIGLGHLSCLGSIVPESQLDAGMQVTIEPLYPDGSAGPAWHGTLGERAAVEPFIDEPEAVAPVAATIDAGPPRDPTGPRWPILVGLVAGALGVGLLARRFIPAREAAAGRGGYG